MSLRATVPGYDALHFQLVDNSPGSDLQVLCLTCDESDKATWLEVISDQLEQQQNLLAGE